MYNEEFLTGVFKKLGIPEESVERWKNPVTPIDDTPDWADLVSPTQQDTRQHIKTPLERVVLDYSDPNEMGVEQEVYTGWILYRPDGNTGVLSLKKGPRKQPQEWLDSWVRRYATAYLKDQERRIKSGRAVQKMLEWAASTDFNGEEVYDIGETLEDRVKPKLAQVDVEEAPFARNPPPKDLGCSMAGWNPIWSTIAGFLTGAVLMWFVLWGLFG